MTKRDKIFGELDRIAPLVPVPLYWLDNDFIIVGGNELCVDAIGGGGQSINEVLIGKSYYDYYPKEIADELTDMIKLVLESNKPIKVEEKIIDITTGKLRYYETARAPLFGDSGNVVGTICTAIEITDKKEAEVLRVDNKAKQARIEEQEKFKKIADQVAHDIRSPIATMQMVLPQCDVLPENLRDTLNKSAIRIADIANNLLSHFKSKEEEKATSDIKRAPELISAELLEVLTEKKYEYSQLSVDFISKINQNAYFAFINIDVRAFKRSISNLINNSVDSFDEKIGEVTVNMVADDSTVKIIIQDNGKGMPAEVAEKIMNNIEITSGKKAGFGIGFTQVRDMLQSNDGKLTIESILDMGSKITISFPRVKAPEWIAEKIDIYPDDLVIVLDDDESIHGAWEARFGKAAPNIARQHFKQGHEVVEFINNLSDDEKKKVFLLSDYELLRQNLNGLDVIEKTKITRSVLVTSHHNNPEVRAAAKLTHTKILPKPLASEIPITILHHETLSQTSVISDTKLRTVDLVIIDDDKDFVDSFVRFIAHGNKTVDKYYTAHEFQDIVSQYPKDTEFLIDNTFKGEDITGVELSKKLHELGFTNLHLFSGKDLSGDNSIPSYLDLILKTDLEKVKRLVGA